MPAKKKAKSSQADFEQSMQELETLVEAMESGELTLEQSIEHFEQGTKLFRICHKSLTEAEQKVKILMQDANGETLADFDTSNNS